MKEFDEILSEIENDKVSGSITLVDRIVDELTIRVKNLSPAQMEEIILSLGKFVDRKPFFYVFQHLIELLTNSNDWRMTLEKYKHDARNSITIITNKFIQFIHSRQKTYLLHSNSKTIIDVFQGLAEENIGAKIFQTYSKPGKEGIVQGNLLRNFGFDVTLVDDLPTDSILDKVDVFISGADVVSKNEIINKTGTRLLAERMHSLRKTYIVLADARKFTTEMPLEPPPEFELVPRKLISRIISN